MTAVFEQIVTLKYPLTARMRQHPVCLVHLVVRDELSYWHFGRRSNKEQAFVMYTNLY